MVDHVLLISGPAGAGKSSVGEQWASSRQNRCAHIELDDFRRLLKSGYVDPRDEWNDEAQYQLDLARLNVASVTKNYIEAGVEVVVDDVAFPDWEPSGLERWRIALAPIEIDFVVLFPNWKTVMERNSGRIEEDRLPVPMLRKIYDDMVAWKTREGVTVIDNSDLTVTESVSEIETAIAR